MAKKTARKPAKNTAATNPYVKAFIARSPWKPTTSASTGAAPLTPLTPCMGSPLALPTQTPTVNRSVKPMHQLSRMSLLVPVLTAAKPRVANLPRYSSPRARASHHLQIAALCLRNVATRTIWKT